MQAVVLICLLFTIFFVVNGFLGRSEPSPRQAGVSRSASMEPKYYESVVAPSYIPFPNIVRGKPRQILPVEGGDDRFIADPAVEREAEATMAEIRKDYSKLLLLNKLKSQDHGEIDKMETLRTSEDSVAYDLRVFESPAASPLSAGVFSGDLLDEWDKDVI
jgi:hypothetical protein